MDSALHLDIQHVKDIPSRFGQNMFNNARVVVRSNVELWVDMGKHCMTRVNVYTEMHFNHICARHI